jgi:hypothetical protein
MTSIEEVTMAATTLDSWHEWLVAQLAPYHGTLNEYYLVLSWLRNTVADEPLWGRVPWWLRIVNTASR